MVVEQLFLLSSFPCFREPRANFEIMLNVSDVCYIEFGFLGDLPYTCLTPHGFFSNQGTIGSCIMFITLFLLKENNPSAYSVSSFTAVASANEPMMVNTC